VWLRDATQIRPLPRGARGAGPPRSSTLRRAQARSRPGPRERFNATRTIDLCRAEFNLVTARDYRSRNPRRIPIASAQCRQGSRHLEIEITVVDRAGTYHGQPNTARAALAATALPAEAGLRSIIMGWSFPALKSYDPDATVLCATAFCTRESPMQSSLINRRGLPRMSSLSNSHASLKRAPLRRRPMGVTHNQTHFPPVSPVAQTTVRRSPDQPWRLLDDRLPSASRTTTGAPEATKEYSCLRPLAIAHRRRISCARARRETNLTLVPYTESAMLSSRRRRRVSPRSIIRTLVRVLNSQLVRAPTKTVYIGDLRLRARLQPPCSSRLPSCGTRTRCRVNGWCGHV
jgi:hypothetical protein